MPGHHWAWTRQREAPIVLLPSTRLPRVVPDTPFDHLAPHGDAGESAITNACTPREDTGTQPLTRCRVWAGGQDHFSFWRFAIACRWQLAVTDTDESRCFGLFQRLRSPREPSEIASYDTPLDCKAIEEHDTI